MFLSELNSLIVNEHVSITSTEPVVSCFKSKIKAENFGAH